MMQASTASFKMIKINSPDRQAMIKGEKGL